MATQSKLTDKAINAYKPKDKIYVVNDGNGLALSIETSGSKFWRFRYYFNLKPVLYTIGEYPYITLKQAREERDKLKALLANGIDPRQHKQQLKAERMARNRPTVPYCQ